MDKAKGKAIGIDLGTTNSVASYFDGSRSTVLRNSHNQELTPSVVVCEKFSETDEGEIRVGRDAVSQAKLFPNDTIFSIKRLMGQPFSDENVQKARARVNYSIVDHNGMAAVMMVGKLYMPEEISALILKEIKRYSELALGEVTHAVITVPAYFREPQIAATREAGRKAGFVVKRVLPEPTAAAIAFGSDIKLSGNTVLVFDLGGGTFDISILGIVGTNFNQISVSGDHFLGGNDIDALVVQMILEEVRKVYNVDLSRDPRFRIVAGQLAEEAKISLSNTTNSVANIIAPEVANVGGKVINLRMKITREAFEEAISPAIVERCRKLVQEAFEAKSMTPDLIDDVLLVGGSTSVPAVYRSMEAVFGTAKIRRNVDPMQCVAIGAGILAYRMKGIECPKCLQICDESADKCPHCDTSLAAARPVLAGITVTEASTSNYGVQVVSGTDANRFKILVEKDTQLPMSEPAVETFYTTEQDQRVIRVPVYQGISHDVKRNTPIGVVRYTLPTGLPSNHAVAVEFRLDRQAIVTVRICVEGFTAFEQTLDHSLGEELTKQDSPEQQSQDDEDERVSQAERNLALLESFVLYTRDFLAEYERILTNSEKEKLVATVASADGILDRRDDSQAEKKVSELNRLLLRCGTASLIAQAVSAANEAMDENVGRKLRSDAAELKRAAESPGNTARILELKDPIAAMVRQVNQSNERKHRIYSEIAFDGLLRMKEMGA